MYSSRFRKIPMNASPQHSPVIVLLGTHALDNARLEEWLASSRYRTWAAEDVFQVLEQVSDFTVRNRPEVVFLHVGETDEEQDYTRSMIKAGTGDTGVPVIDMVALSRSENSADLSVTLLDLACQLDQFIPQDDAAAH
jgi:hypothetical protein